MNKDKEVQRHLIEARLHLEIAKIYLGGFDDYIECVDVTAAYDLINNIITKYQIKEFEEEIKKEKDVFDENQCQAVLTTGRCCSRKGKYILNNTLYCAYHHNRKKEASYGM